MRKLLLIAVSVLFLGQSFATLPVEPSKPKLKATEIFFPVGKTGKKISLMELTSISIADLQALTQRKMSDFERMAFKSTQKKLRKGISPDGTITKKKIDRVFNSRGGESGFHFGGFALGFFLGPIGIIIAYVINDDLKKQRVKWAWLGFGIGVAVSLILVLAVFSTV